MGRVDVYGEAQRRVRADRHGCRVLQLVCWAGWLAGATLRAAVAVRRRLIRYRQPHLSPS